MAKEECVRSITFNDKLTLSENITPEGLIDLLGNAKELEAEGKRKANFYKEALKGRVGDEGLGVCESGVELWGRCGPQCGVRARSVVDLDSGRRRA